ncbi:MAG TPA: hypothetical protein EYP14_04955, partial [Planctomycetaceae bacterium]|nr:hypothetical protein [Planctomycetaceae bacterium]
MICRLKIPRTSFATMSEQLFPNCPLACQSSLRAARPPSGRGTPGQPVSGRKSTGRGARYRTQRGWRPWGAALMLLGVMGPGFAGCGRSTSPPPAPDAAQQSQGRRRVAVARPKESLPEKKQAVSRKAVPQKPPEQPTAPSDRAEAVQFLKSLGVDVPKTDASSVAKLDLHGQKRVNDESLKYVIAFPELESLDLRGTGLTDDGLPRLSGLSRLKELHLAETAITDAGLKHLEPLARLEVLN